MDKTVFISSTYEDLAEHRRAVWQVLEGFHLAVRGMEQFGARTEAPLQTCLAEVEQSDVYVGIVAFRLGSIDAQSGKSFTQLEYERALELDRTVLIYLADERLARVRYADIDVDHLQRERLSAFKATLRERHTVNMFSTAEDLASKLRTDFAKHFEPASENAQAPDSEFESTLALVQRFRLLPRTVVGRQVRLTIARIDNVFPASRTLCEAFNLEYGRTVGVYIRVLRPEHKDMNDFKEIYASGARVDDFLSLLATRKPVEVYARLEFTAGDVHRVQGEFFGYSFNYEPEPGDPSEQYVAPEGKVILLFAKRAP